MQALWIPGCLLYLLDFYEQYVLLWNTKGIVHLNLNIIKSKTTYYILVKEIVVSTEGRELLMAIQSLLKPKVRQKVTFIFLVDSNHK